MESLQFLCDERVYQGLVNADPFRRVQHKHLVQEVLQLVHFSEVGIIQVLGTDQGSKEVTRRRNGTHYCDFLLKGREERGEKEGEEDERGRKREERRGKETNKSSCCINDNTLYLFCDPVNF